MTCKHCNHLVVMPDSDGKRRVRKGYSYPCSVNLPVMQSMPSCMTYTVTRLRMEGSDGADCVAFEALK